MIINYAQTQMVGGIIVFPEFTPVLQPSPDPIIETIFLPMSTDCSSPSITGIVNDAENGPQDSSHCSC